jgi:Ferritin-like domain
MREGKESMITKEMITKEINTKAIPEIENTAELSETKRLDNIIASRRRLMTLGGAALAGLALGQVASAQTAVTDTDILNFALNLEYLEAEYYTIATSGMTIDQMGIGVTGTGTQGTVIIKNGSYASAQVPFANTAIQAYANETATEERKHVAFLRNALGSAAVAQPSLDLLNSFNGLAVFAGIGASFDPFASDVNFLLGSYIFEDVGVTAYLGAAALITTPAYLDAAAGILAVEAYHAGLIRTALYGLDAATPSAGINATATKISKARATLDGTGTDDIGLGTTTNSIGTASTIVNADVNTLAFVRTTAQVLAIVYAGGVANGGFFPASLNGTIK